MIRGKDKTEYEKFKEGESKYVLSKVDGYEEGKKEKKHDWVWWLLFLVVMSVATYFSVNYMMDSREEVYNASQIARLDASDAVEQMYDSDDTEWIRRNLTQEEYDQIEEMVDEVPESSDKVKINIRLREAGKQLKDQLEALELVKGLTISTGEANIDLSPSRDLIGLETFPSNYHPAYVEELKAEYKSLSKVIQGAYDLQKQVKELFEKSSKNINSDVIYDQIDKVELDNLSDRANKLPTSSRKQEILNDIDVLYDRYEDEQEVIKEKREREERERREREERERIERERREREERERREREEREQREREREEQERREQEAEIERIEREERERIERELEEELRREQERLEQEEREREEQEQLEQDNNNNNHNQDED